MKITVFLVAMATEPKPRGNVSGTEQVSVNALSRLEVSHKRMTLVDDEPPPKKI